MKEQTITPGRDLTDHIHHQKGVIDVPFCEDVLREYADSDEWEKSLVQGAEENPARNCEVIYMSLPRVTNVNPQVRQSLDKGLFNALSKSISLYGPRMGLFQPTEDSGYNLLKYTTGQFYKQHYDASSDTPRSLSVIMSLTSSYEGGDVVFWGTNSYRLERGDVLIFPSSFIFPHEVSPVTSGTRYTVVTWVK
jgi:predicted 2-oxoglutarate/Fe(II)-dependent dioxygenase YbiX